MTVLLQDIFDQSVAFLSQHDLFYGHGVQLAEDEVLLLLMHVLKVDFKTLNEMSQQAIKPQQLDYIQTLLAKRVEQKIPMVYLVGFAVFAGLKFKIDERVLIPRSPFVELIDAGFEPWLSLNDADTGQPEKNRPIKVMDLCTGSGCIGLAIAHYFGQCEVDLVDLSFDALQLAHENVEILGLTERVRCIESDLFSAIDQQDKIKYDLIVANPPYVAEQEYLSLPPEYEHEPKMALVSALEGMEIPIKILSQASDYMTEQGCLFLEVGYNDELLNASLPNVSFQWLEFELGGQGICVFSRHDLLKYRLEFMEFLELHVT